MAAEWVIINKRLALLAELYYLCFDSPTFGHKHKEEETII